MSAVKKQHVGQYARTLTHDTKSTRQLYTIQGQYSWLHVSRGRDALEQRERCSLGLAFQLMSKQKNQLHGRCARTRCDLADSTAETEGYHEEHCMTGYKRIQATGVHTEGTVPNLQGDYRTDNTKTCEVIRTKLDIGLRGLTTVE
jgi:hypothetical protein